MSFSDNLTQHNSSTGFIPHYQINRISEVVDNFNIEFKIGSGTFGTVYMASLKQNPLKQYALKHIIATCLPARIKSEIKYLALLKDFEHVISVETFIRYNDNVVLVMPYFDHNSFTDYFNIMSITEVQQYIKGLFRSLKVVHDHHIIHRDIKPSNFLYNCKNRTFKLIDFGLAHFQNEYSGTDEDLLTRPSLKFAKKKNHLSSFRVVDDRNFCNHAPLEICDICCSRSNQQTPRAGTSGYRAPEVLLRYQYQTTAIDVWSAGVIFLSLLSGKYPFFKSNDDLTAMIQISLLFGSKHCKEAAKHMGKELHILPYHHAQNLCEVCSHLKNVCKHPEPVSKAYQKDSNCTCNDSNVLSQSNIHSSKGTWTTAPLAAYDLLQKCLELNPSLRITAAEALNHPFLQNTE